MTSEPPAHMRQAVVGHAIPPPLLLLLLTMKVIFSHFQDEKAAWERPALVPVVAAALVVAQWSHRR